MKFIIFGRYDPASQQRTKLLQRVKLDPAVHLGEQYNLYAAVVHCGSSVDSGHYYTYAKDGEDWYKFNDCAVIQSSEEELCNLRPPETPYILFYSRYCANLNVRKLHLVVKCYIIDLCYLSFLLFRCDCSDPENLPRPSLSAKLEAILVRDDTEQKMERRQRQVKTYSTRQNKNDEPPPPGCGGGGILDSSLSRYVC